MIKKMIKDIKKMSANELKLYNQKVHDSMLSADTKRKLLDEIDKRFSSFKYSGDGLVEVSEIKLGDL